MGDEQEKFNLYSSQYYSTLEGRSAPTPSKTLQEKMVPRSIVKAASCMTLQVLPGFKRIVFQVAMIGHRSKHVFWQIIFLTAWILDEAIKT